MSTLKADAVTSQSTNGDLTISGNGTGVPDIEAGFKVGGTVGVPISGLQVGTDGELITWDASGDPAAVAVGTATHVLTSNGAGAAPTFQAGAGGYSSVSTKTGNYTVVAGDNGALIKMNGEYDFSITAVATLGISFSVSLMNISSAPITVTIDPNASETVNGYTTLEMLAGEVGILYCDGTQLFFSSLNFDAVKPQFHATHGLNSNVIGGGGHIDPIPYNSERFDIGANYDTSTYKFTAPVDGTYSIGVLEGYQGLTTGVTYFYLYINASNINPTVLELSGAIATGNRLYATETILIDMDKADTVYTYTGASGTTNVVDMQKGNFWGHLVSRGL